MKGFKFQVAHKALLKYDKRKMYVSSTDNIPFRTLSHKPDHSDLKCPYYG